MHSGFPTEKVEQMIVTSFYDITRISHAIGEGTICKIKEKASPLGISYLFFKYVIINGYFSTNPKLKY